LPARNSILHRLCLSKIKLSSASPLPERNSLLHRLCLSKIAFCIAVVRLRTRQVILRWPSFTIIWLSFTSVFVKSFAHQFFKNSMKTRK
jgi:hypothetical protein